MGFKRMRQKFKIIKIQMLVATNVIRSIQIREILKRLNAAMEESTITVMIQTFRLKHMQEDNPIVVI